MRWAHGRGMDLTLIETMPLGEIDGDRTDQYLPLSEMRARLESVSRSSRHPLQDRRPGALCRRSPRPAAASASSRR
jgi:molybdenum cofactor biosynthesis enzyme MoaA